MKNSKTKKPPKSYKRKFYNVNNKESRGHPAYIYAKVGGKLKYLGITHGEISKGVKNIELIKNPDPTDAKKSYIRPKAGEAKQKHIGKEHKNWKFSKEDRPTVASLIRQNKKKGK